MTENINTTQKSASTDFWSTFTSTAGNILSTVSGSFFGIIGKATTFVTDFIKKKIFKDKDTAQNEQAVSTAMSTPDQSENLNGSPTMDIETAKAWANPNLGIVLNYLSNTATQIETAGHIPDSTAYNGQMNYIKDTCAKTYGNNEEFMHALEDPAVRSLLENFSNMDTMAISDRKVIWTNMKAYHEAANKYVDAYNNSNDTAMKSAAIECDNALILTSTVIDKYESDKSGYVSQGEAVTELDLLSDVSEKFSNKDVHEWVNEYITYNSNTNYVATKPRSETYDDGLSDDSEVDRQYE